MLELSFSTSESPHKNDTLYHSYGYWRGNYSQGLFLLQCCPVQQEGWLMPRALTSPGPGPAALPAQQLSFLGLQETCRSCLGSTNTAAAHCPFCVGCGDGSCWSSPCTLPGTDRNSLEGKRKRKRPAAPTAPAASVPSLPHFLT